MGTQLRPPAGWAAMISHRDPHSRLHELSTDMIAATSTLRAALEGLAEKYGIDRRDVDFAMLRLDDTLADFTDGVRADLEGEIIDELPGGP